jgi:hypothetical protein
VSHTYIKSSNNPFKYVVAHTSLPEFGTSSGKTLNWCIRGGCGYKRHVFRKAVNLSRASECPNPILPRTSKQNVTTTHQKVNCELTIVLPVS